MNRLSSFVVVEIRVNAIKEEKLAVLQITIDDKQIQFFS